MSDGQSKDIDRDDYSPRHDQEALGVSQAAVGRLSGVNPRTARRWFTDRPGDTPRAVRIMLQLMLKHGEDPEDWLPPSGSVAIRAPMGDHEPSK